MGRTFYSNALESVGYGNEFVIKGFINDYPSLGNFQNYPAIIETTKLNEGDAVEFLYFMGGGAY